MPRDLNWLFEADAYGEEQVELLKAVRAAGMKAAEVHRNHLTLHGSGGDDAPQRLFRGTCPGARKARAGGAVVWCDLPRLACSYYFCRFAPHDLLNADGVFVPLGRVTHYLGWKAYPDVFVRPDRGDKPFDGQVLRAAHRHGDFAQLTAENPPPETLCLVAPAVEIVEEYRFVVRTDFDSGRHEVVTSCRYAPEEAAEVPVAAVRFLEAALDRSTYAGDPLFVADVCALADGRFKLLELNGFSSAGLYCCDMPAVAAAAKLAYEDHYVGIYPSAE